MARASIRTMLSLDRYAKIMGINPAFFSGGSDIELTDGRVLFPLSNAQNDIWPQYSWQNFDQVSREELARSIFDAEFQIMQYLGFNLVPAWTIAEEYDLPSHYRPELQYAPVAYDASLNPVQLRTKKALFISGGQRTTTLIDGRASVVYSDPDADSWSELATIQITIPSGTDPLEVKLYFVGHNADQTYEIRMPKTKTQSGNTLTFTYNTWQLVDPDVYESLPYNDTTSNWIDFSDTGNFVTTVEAYREYNDTTKNHCLFNFVDTTNGSQTTQGGFIYKTFENDMVTPVEANYNSTTGAWETVITQCAYPDNLKMWYYSGIRDMVAVTNDFDTYMPNDLAVAVAYLATARLERGYYANNNATALAARLREDLLQSDRDTFRAYPPEATSNPFGSKFGELQAWRMVNRFRQPRRSGGSL